MKISLRRMQPPVASPIDGASLLHGFLGLFCPRHYVRCLDNELKAHFNVQHVFNVSSGKAGLVLILRAMKRLAPLRDEVIVPGYTCFSVPSAIVNAGLTPVVCDVDPRALDYSFDRLPAVIGDRTLCVISCDLFGRASNVSRLREVCSDNGVFIVDDAAQAMGGEHDGQQLGTRGDAGLFSLGRGKCVSAGSGGIILTNSDAIGAELTKEYRSLPPHGILESIRDLLVVLIQSLLIHPNLFWIPAGIPQLRIGETHFHRSIAVKRLSGMSAGLMRRWRKRLDASNALRRSSGRVYEERLLKELPRGEPVPYLRFPFLLPTTNDKAAILSNPLARSLGISPMYPSGIEDISELHDTISRGSCPSSKSIADRLITLPTHRYVSDDDKHRICDLLLNQLERRALSPTLVD
ncbi:MAG: DegT/DnrJ/EryC1/StrS family aminotransferase [Sterolibacteriaceae bacterium]|nr:DegT/DnrJ/EryC1/StrS family aminotransferase [Candidatus Methylophosphatis haderslevensis]